MLFERGSAETEMLYAMARTGNRHLTIMLGLSCMTRDTCATMLTGELVAHAGEILSDTIHRRGVDVFAIVSDEISEIIASLEAKHGRMGDLRFLCQSLYSEKQEAIVRLEEVISGRRYALLPAIILGDRDYAKLQVSRAQG